MHDERPSHMTPDQAARLRQRLLALATSGPDRPRADRVRGDDRPRRRDPLVAATAADGRPPETSSSPADRPPRRRGPLVAAAVPAPDAAQPLDPAQPHGAPDLELEPAWQLGAPDLELEPAWQLGAPDLELEPAWQLGAPDADDRWTRTSRLGTRTGLTLAAAAVLLVAAAGMVISATRGTDDPRGGLATQVGDRLDTAGRLPTTSTSPPARPRLPDLAVPGLTGGERAPALPRRSAGARPSGRPTTVPGTRSSAGDGGTGTAPAPTEPTATAAPRPTSTTTPGPSGTTTTTTPGTTTTTAPGSTTTKPPTTTTTTTTEPPPSADVSTTKVSHVPRTHTSGVWPFQTTTYSYTLELRVANSGPSTAEGVVVTITVSTGSVNVTDPPASWACERPSSTEVRCSTASLASGDGATLVATGSGDGSTARWSTSSTTPDPSPGNGSGSVS